ncbi:MAG: hypothetical protein A2029_01015 [Chloroflexi bacterium RBG_19FT_COMBO_47_9]|nr:MAG: hypothetical protein A2029_01015 [Chloroflexi bacterium RBG_19FT_COMBO_47_9]
MITKNYGKNKILFSVTEKPDGSIEVHVYTDNETVRSVINNHCTDPRFFLNNYYEYKKSNIAAKKWLAKIVFDYRNTFEAGKVSFILKSEQTIPSKSTNIKPVNHRNIIPVEKHTYNEKIPLSEFGFQKVGYCTLNINLKNGISFILEKLMNERVIYAFVIDDEVKYIGVCDTTNTMLKNRMGRYQQMTASGTNERITRNIIDCLTQGKIASIWALLPDCNYEYKGIKVDPIKGLENPLIQHFHPEWNIKK